MKKITTIILLLICVNSFSQSPITISERYGIEGRLTEVGWISPMTTSNATPTLYFSIPIAQNNDVKFVLHFDSHKSDYLLSDGGDVIMKFSRGSGNLLQQGDPIGQIVMGFRAAKPTISIVANTSTQSIDVTVIGIAATDLIWSANYSLTYNP